MTEKILNNGIRDIRGQAAVRTPEQLIKHMKTFRLQPKFSAGIWYFSPANTRFHDKYKPDLSIEERLNIAAEMRKDGLEGIEAHYPNEINEDNMDVWKSFIRDSGIKLVTIVPLLFWDRRFEFGSLSSPIGKERKYAVELTERTLLMNKEMGTEFAVVWPGIDGYENPFGIDFAAMRRRFAEGLATAMDNVPGVRIAFEPKPYEPRGHIIYGTTPEGMLLCRDVESRLKNRENIILLKEGHKLACLNPEIGHAMMAYEDLPYTFSYPLAEGRLAHMHLNSQPPGNYDQDLNVGTVAPEQFEALMYVLKMHGYNGWFGIDINPERMPVETALRISMDAVISACDRVNEMDHESIINAANNPDLNRGWIESYLIHARATNPKKLSPMKKVVHRRAQ